MLTYVLLTVGGFQLRIVACAAIMRAGCNLSASSHAPNSRLRLVIPRATASSEAILSAGQHRQPWRQISISSACWTQSFACE